MVAVEVVGLSAGVMSLGVAFDIRGAVIDLDREVDGLERSNAAGEGISAGAA